MGNVIVSNITRTPVESGSNWGSVAGVEPSLGTLLFEQVMTGTNDEPLYEIGSPHAGGGTWQLLPNSSNGAGSGINSTNWSVETITDDPLYPGSQKVMRDLYQSGGTAYTFANQTWFLGFPESTKIYVTMRVRWSSNWQWGGDQLKFAKNRGGAGGHVSCNTWFNGDGNLLLTRNAANTYIYAADPPPEKIEDDIINNFGGAGVDANWSPVLGQWYTLAWEIDAVSGGSVEGYNKVWVDGELYMQAENLDIAQVGDAMFSMVELGHVWQTGSPTADISMDFHKLKIYGWGTA